MITFLLIFAYVVGALAMGRYVGRSVYKGGSFYTTANYGGVKPGDRDGAVIHAVLHGLFWPIFVLAVALLLGVGWFGATCEKVVPALGRVFIGKKMLDSDNKAN